MQVRPQSYETEAMPSIHPCDAANDQQYIELYSAMLRQSILAGRCRRWVDQHKSRTTDTVSIPSPEQAGAALLTAAERHYRLSRRPMSHDTAYALQALQYALHDPAKCITALSDALLCFVHTLAVIEDGQLYRAVKSAQLSLKTLQSTWAELPAVSQDTWLLNDKRGEM